MLAELASYYEQLIKEHSDEVPSIGWCSTRVSFVLQLNSSGEVESVIPLQDKKAMVRVVPQQEKRAVNIAANFLCDNSSYLLGLDTKDNRERTAKCFGAAKALHHEVLDGVQSDCAQSILKFFDTWLRDKEVLSSVGADEGVLSGRNITFSVKIGNEIQDPLDDEEVREAWNRHLSVSGKQEAMRCLVTGEIAPVARLHPAIKGVQGAQSSGASLVSFNAPAFASYGHDGEQGRNAPVSEHAAQAYGIALNYLLSKPSHRTQLGDTTIVYWSDKKDVENTRAFGAALGFGLLGEDLADDMDAYVDHTMKAITRGDYRDLDGADPDAEFFVLGLAPSAARLVVKFFLKDSFGSMLDNLRKHYARSDVSHHENQKPYLTPYQLLREVENPKAKKPTITPVLIAPLITAILQDAPYPQALYANALLRIHSTQADEDAHVQKVSRGRAAIIRSYLIKNCTKQGYDERSLTVSLNQERNETAYNLGRAFTLFEQIQERANGKATLTNRYYNAASTTPASVFPTIVRLSKAHLTKIERDNPGLARWFEKQLEEVLGEDRVYAFPKRLSLEEQGDFALGSYHQARSRFESKVSDKNNAGTTNDEE